jgi:hypothetical protein
MTFLADSSTQYYNTTLAKEIKNTFSLNIGDVFLVNNSRCFLLCTVKVSRCIKSTMTFHHISFLKVEGFYQDEKWLESASPAAVTG